MIGLHLPFVAETKVVREDVVGRFRANLVFALKRPNLLNESCKINGRYNRSAGANRLLKTSKVLFTDAAPVVGKRGCLPCADPSRSSRSRAWSPSGWHA